MVVYFFTQISKEEYVLVLMFYSVLSRNSELEIICRLLPHQWQSFIINE